MISLSGYPLSDMYVPMELKSASIQTQGLIFSKHFSDGPACGLGRLPAFAVGRCADHVLRDFSNVFNVFVHSPVEDRIKRVVGEYGISPEDAEQEVRQVDRGRANHYRTYTGREWRDPLHYDLCLDSSTLGVENCAAMIAEAAGRACGRNS